MFANSRSIATRQVGPHPRLKEIVARHLREPYRRAPSAAGRHAFDSIAARLAAAPFVLDAGCGTGASTLALAREFPDSLVLGVDKSITRLGVSQRAFEHRARAGAAPDNMHLLHCELVDFWQLAAEAKLRCTYQFLLYPNPWPKPEHMMRRWHAHPVLPAVLALGGAIELRTNWRIYAEEFAQTMAWVGRKAPLEQMPLTQPLTPFERKYAASGHALWRCIAQSPGR
ncbi:MAG: methyltransferase domain-containing protein [Gammaproteobacteria bacterium]|nr:MAG: methyltransferase domain-containing protein [Gammaproteobacteria bacterium]